MERLKGKVAFITGGTSGIGRATAKDFIDEGAKVIITGRYRDTLDEAVQDLGPSAYGIVSDSGNMDDVFRLKENVMELTDKIDILFANAGYGKFAPVEAVTEKMFDEVFNIVVKGTFFTIQQLLSLMTQDGSIILNTSVVTRYGSPGSAIYSSAKSAVRSLMTNLAAELTDQNVRVNAVSPGYTDTNIFNKTGLTPDQITAAKAGVTPTLPFRRFASASEIAKAVTFLASNEASYVHGAELLVDGGYTSFR